MQACLQTKTEQRYSTPKELARAIVAAVRDMRNTDRHGSWKGLVAAGRVLRFDCSKEFSFAWLQAGKLNATAVRNVLAAQEGCFLTRASPSNREVDSTCRKCGSGWETAEHNLTSCSRWLANQSREILAFAILVKFSGSKFVFD